LLDTLPNLDDHRFEDGCRTMDVGSWLRSLGLGQYEAAFRDNKIAADLLSRLTDAGLKDIGVSALGDRLRLLDAIAALASAMPLANSAVSPPKTAALKDREQSAERRPITVMFCDLVGSTSLTARLDPEDWRNLVNAYLDQASAAVTDFGGHVLKKLGDGLMALFGYPQAQENDAERGVRAALAIQRALAELNARNANSGAPELLARIGLESGPVVVESAGEVFGEAPNIAARVHAAAEPGSVLITMNVQRQVAGLFVAEERGEHELKGVAATVQLFRIIRASSGRRRGGARALTPFVGREEELGLLTRRWERARAGEGQLALVAGEPGLGKSRLIEEFHARLAGTPYTWVEWSASQLLQNTPLHPIAEWGRQRFGLDAPAQQRLADLEDTLRLIGLDPAEYAPLLGPLVDIPLPPGRAASFPPDELRRRQLAAMTAWILAGARSQSVVLAFEDLHWADPTSLDLLRALGERGAQTPLLLLATTRPEFRPPWSLRSHHSVISLSPLDRAGVARMVGEISARHALSKEVIEGVSERTGGVPLFVEEVTRLLLERGVQGGVQAIPPTLQQSLAARLDRLGPAREVAQIGAVLGRDFAYSQLRDVAGLDESALQPALERLTEADLLFVEGALPEAKYRFKHALIQDAAYESLLKSRRQTLHRRAAEALRDANAEPEAIAYHFTEARLDDLAIEWWGKAGDQALRRSAFQEAISHLGKAIEMADKAAVTTTLTTVPETNASRRVKLQRDYTQAVLWSKGWAADTTKAAFERTSDLAASAELPAARLPALYGQVVWSLVRGEIRAAKNIAECFLREAEAEGLIAEAIVARQMLGVACLMLGDLAESRSQLELALNSYDRERASEVSERVGMDAGVSSRAILAHTAWHLGDLQRARRLIEEAIGLARELGHPPTTGMALWYKVLIEGARNDPERVLTDAENLLKISQQHGMEFHAALSRVYLSWARGRLSDARSGADELRNSLADYTSQGNRAGIPAYLGFLAELEAAAGDADRALTLISEGLAAGQEGGN
jgi:class 3 adenylate cyclase/tetratricopeptide (TPR) repeat protein